MGRFFFIRNDDVWRLDKRFRYFFDLAFERNVPVVHAVIPGKLETGLVRFLCRAKDRAPHLVDIVQHGWMHANYADAAARPYEFGPLRSLKQQRGDIHQGLNAMRAAFGEHFIPAFVPPYHGYDLRTRRVLAEEGFRLFSAGERRLPGQAKFLEVPQHVSFSYYEQGQPVIHMAAEVFTALAQGVKQRSLSGVLTHHDEFASAGARQELKRFFDLVAAAVAKQQWRPLLFSDILARGKA